MNQITKKQHYVPRFLLDGFRVNDKKEKLAKINIINLHSDKKLLKQSVDEFFSQKYFYDKDNKIENFINIHIESPSSSLIKSFRENNFERLNVNCECLVKLICCQLLRTQETLNQVLEYANETAHHISRNLIEINNIDCSGEVEDIFSLAYSDKESKRSLISQMVINSVLISKGMEDLKFHILINKSTHSFVISDHPVSKYNWYYKEKKSPQVSSLMVKGVQLFIPISSEMYLCAYDCSVYKYGDKKSDVSYIKDTKDVYFLNSLQVRNANYFIGFNNDIAVESIQGLISKFLGKKIYTIHSRSLSEPVNKVNNEVSSVGLMYYKQINLKQKPTFFKVLKKEKINQNDLAIRNPYLVDGVRMLFKHAENNLSEFTEP